MVSFSGPGKGFTHRFAYNAPALKQPYLLPISKPVRKRWDASIGIDLKEPGFLLRVLGELDLGCFV